MPKKEFEVMRCVDCGRELPYPSMFPVPIYAECWKCCWNRHITQFHPPTRADKKKLKRRISKELQRRYFEELKKTRSGTFLEGIKPTGSYIPQEREETEIP